MDFAYAYNPLLLKPVLRRDRAVVGIALLILILLAWFYVGRLAASVQVAGMDMTGMRIVSAGSRMVMTSEPPALERCRVRLHVSHVGGHDGRDDAAGRPPRWFCTMHVLAVRLPSMPNRSARPGGLRPVICSYGSDLRLPPPAHNGRLNAPGC